MFKFILKFRAFRFIRITYFPLKERKNCLFCCVVVSLTQHSTVNACEILSCNINTTGM